MFKYLMSFGNQMKLVSACLLDFKCLYDGKISYKNKKVLDLLQKEILIPFCPEQMGGLHSGPGEP